MMTRVLDLARILAAVLFFFLPSAGSFAQDLCVNGFAAGIYPCENVDLMAFVSSADLGAGANVEYNDIWGWTDQLDGKEYVMIGRSDGTSFVDISDPLNPVNLGFLPTHTLNSIWRDIKVYGDYAFIVSEASGHGMQVFDLTRLRNVANPPETFTEDAHYAGFGNAHNVVINPDVALAYGVGTNTFSGGFHIVDISNPLNPVIAGDFAADGYTHDAQVVTYNGPDAAHVGKQIGFACNENALTIIDLNDPTDTQQLSTSGYTSVGYAHQGWLSPDQVYFYLSDELDEVNFGNNTRTIIWDVSDLENPIVIGQYVSTEAAIDHNLYTDGNLIFESNYRAGLRILDGQDVANANLSEVAYFDVYPASNSAQFNGSWSNYPYFSSGIVAVSHIEEGLFLLRPQFLHTTTAQTEYCYGDDVVVDVTIEAGFAGPVTMSVTGGLPAGASASFSANDVGPGSYTLTLSNLPQVTGELTIEVSASNGDFTYRSDVTFLVFDCVNEQLGCTDPAATNYNPAAVIDDGSCTYPCVDVTLQIDTDCWGGETSWILQDDAGIIIDQISGNSLGNQTTYTWNYCLEVGCYSWVINDSFGDGLSGIASGCAVDGNYQITDGSGNVLLSMAVANFGSSVAEPFCIAINEPGCTDPAACNYSPSATTDDGSCQLPDGCTDPAACNYSAASLCDDGSCTYGTTWYLDNDSDGFGDALVEVIACTAPAGYVADNTDCDDNSTSVYPGAPGTGEGIDNNCNGVIDIDEELVTCLGDFNQDGIINASDFLELLGEFACVSNCSTDMDSNGIINATDVLEFLAVFGTTCP